MNIWIFPASIKSVKLNIKTVYAQKVLIMKKNLLILHLYEAKKLILSFNKDSEGYGWIYIKYFKQICT